MNRLERFRKKGYHFPGTDIYIIREWAFNNRPYIPANDIGYLENKDTPEIGDRVLRYSAYRVPIPQYAYTRNAVVDLSHYTPSQWIASVLPTHPTQWQHHTLDQIGVGEYGI